MCGLSRGYLFAWKFAENLPKPKDFTNKLNEGAEGPTQGEPRSQSSRLTSHTPFMRFPNKAITTFRDCPNQTKSALTCPDYAWNLLPNIETKFVMEGSRTYTGELRGYVICNKMKVVEKYKIF